MLAKKAERTMKIETLATGALIGWIVVTTIILFEALIGALCR
jgi:hypothetical protein